MKTLIIFILGIVVGWANISYIEHDESARKNEDGYYRNHYTGGTVYIYPQALPYSTVKLQHDTLAAWMQNDTLFIFPINM